jgi:tripartite-type tricarboxylate transporter receptor subunit TctC
VALSTPADNPTRRRVLAGGTVLMAGQAFGISLATATPRFPQRPISLWVPWPAGGATDLNMRLLAELASKPLGQKVVVENRSGAGGTLAMPVLQQAAPDGYTIAQMPQPVFRAPLLQRLLWDPIRDTTPIIQISGVTFGVVVQPGSPIKTMEDVFAVARDKPGELSIATNGVGTTPHIVLDQLFSARGLQWTHLPYKGVAEQLLAVASGQVMVGINANGFAPFVDSGRLRLVATFGEQRSKRWPSVPTLRELGYGVAASSPYGLAGPRGMPADVVQTLHNAFRTALFDPAHITELERFDQEPAYLDSEAYGKAMRETFAAERRVVEKLGLAKGN